MDVRFTWCAGWSLSVFVALGCGEGAPAFAPPGTAEPLGTAQASEREPAGSVREPINPRLLRRFRPVANDAPPPVVSTPERIELGRMLWFEPRLSNDGTISCDSCHALDRYGSDGRTTSIGDGGQRGRRNAPTVYNAVEHFALFWDGREKSAVAQATMPMLNPTEMASSRTRIESFLRSVPEYRERFARAFPDAAEPVTFEHVGMSLAAFEAGLATRSRWDAYLEGDEGALTDLEVSGLRVFLDVGCMTCHTGPQVGASSFQRVGVFAPWPNQEDLGRFEHTGDTADKMTFKVPTLKNVAHTGPYFHDGSSTTLADAILRMGRHQLGIELEPDEVVALTAFLESLTGPLPAEYIARPDLPAGSPAAGVP